jgi:predicted dehydrogenase
MKICFCGLGSIGKRHLKNIAGILKERGITCSFDAIRTGKDKSMEIEDVQLRHIYHDASELDSDYDVIFITNPTYLHYQSIVACVSKTNHMFIEKPAFENADYNLSTIPFQNGVYYVACPMRHTPIIRYLKENLDVDKVYSIRAISSSYLPDWRENTDYSLCYSADKNRGGGVTLDLIHEWDYISYLFGQPQKILNYKSHYSDLEITSDDISVYIADYGNKLVEIHLDYFGRVPNRKLEIFCKEYVLTADFIRNDISFNYGEKIIQFKKEDFYINEMNYFVDMITSNNPININDVHHAYSVLKLCLGDV